MAVTRDKKKNKNVIKAPCPTCGCPARWAEHVKEFFCLACGWTGQIEGVKDVHGGFASVGG